MESIVVGDSLSKEFSGNRVLNEVSIHCRQGSCLGLVGENGAGKSTLMNILSGVLPPSAGDVYVDGQKVEFSSPLHARKMGIAFVHQELSLMEEMTVGENIMLGREPRRWGLIDQDKLHQQAREVLEDIGFDLAVDVMVCDLSTSERQIVEIAKAWAGKPRVIYFDEPTSSLNLKESQILFSFIDRLKKTGVAVVLISHRMEDIFRACDHVYVLKDGNAVYQSPVSQTNEDELVSKMVGREFSNVFPARNSEKNPKRRVELKDASVGHRIKNINMVVPEGSIIGIGGLEGQGQKTLSRALFGIDPFTSGSYEIDGKPVHIHSPRAAIKNKIGYISDDRKAEGLVLSLPVQDNLISLILRDLSQLGILNKNKSKKAASQSVDGLNIRISSLQQQVRFLSGGNQQKVVLGKWIKTTPRILYLDEPTRGIDVESKLEIYALLRELTQSGVSIVVFTSDILELIGISDEIYVMYGGEISGHLKGSEATEEKIMQLSIRKANKI